MQSKVQQYRSILSKIIDSDSSKQLILSQEDVNSINPISLLSMYVSRSKSNKTSTKPCSNFNKHHREVVVTTNYLNEQRLKFLQRLFKTRCKDLQVPYNEANWKGFLRAFLRKNRWETQTNLQGQKLELRNKQLLNDTALICTQFNFRQSSIPVLDEIIGEYSEVNLSKNLIDPNLFHNLTNSNRLTHLYLNNCGLSNQPLQKLFDKLANSHIKVLSLSSPQLKDRNQLTKYDSLYTLITTNKSLTQLYLSNIQIKKDNPIFDACRFGQVEVLDLSLNSEVCGMCRSLKSLSLSRNDINNPNSLLVQDSALQSLSLSYNHIPFYSLKQFLLTSCYPSLRTLCLDNLMLNGELPVLQGFMQRSCSLKVLTLKECQLNAESYLSVAYGLQRNGILEELDISGNKFPIVKVVAQTLGVAFETSKLRQLRMSLCDLRDEYGAILFKRIRVNKQLCLIDLSKNLIGTETSSVLCENLKKSLYNLMSLKLEQNFIKYDHQKQLKQYIKRNHYLYRVELSECHSKLSEQIRNNAQIQLNVQTSQRTLLDMRQQNDQLNCLYLSKKLNFIKDKGQDLKRQITSFEDNEKVLKKIIAEKQQELDTIYQEERKKLQLSKAGEAQNRQQSKQTSL